MLLLTKEERLVVFGFAVVLSAGAVFQYSFKKFPALRHENYVRSAPASRRVNVNAATIEELVALPSIGQVTAKRIFDYRQRNGSFHRLEDLKSVPGIGPRLYQRLTPYIRIE